jgi:hypothetical protein
MSLPLSFILIFGLGFGGILLGMAGALLHDNRKQK